MPPRAARSSGASRRQLDGQPGALAHRVGAVAQRVVEAGGLAERRAQLVDVAAQRVELTLEHLAQRGDLRARDVGVLADGAIDDLRLEDGVRERLGRPVVQLLREARALLLVGGEESHGHARIDVRRVG